MRHSATTNQAWQMVDLDERLDTGMKLGEAIERGAKWWDKWRLYFREQMVQRNRTRMTPNAPGFTSDDVWVDENNHIPSGILQGWKWDDLKPNEQARVVKVWHHFFIRLEQDGGHMWDKGVCKLCRKPYFLWESDKATCDMATEAFLGHGNQDVAVH